ncbi:MAG: hypothetical protein M1598_04095, partial [Actinobacteria bacterium]|nr:hypothetical protein [Actinomycetota bacterium]
LNHVLHHEPLGPVDAAEEMAAAAARYRLGAEELGIEVGMGGAWAKERLEVLNLREEIREMVRDGRLTERHARALLGIEDGDRALQVAAELAAGDIGMAEAEEMIREMGRGVPASSAPGSGRSSRRRMLRVVKDLRIFLNSFRSAVETLRQGGIAATMTEDDHGNEIEIRVVIPAEPGIGGLKASSEIAGANP